MRKPNEFNSAIIRRQLGRYLELILKREENSAAYYYKDMVPLDAADPNEIEDTGQTCYSDYAARQRANEYAALPKAVRERMEQIRIRQRIFEARRKLASCLNEKEWNYFDVFESFLLAQGKRKETQCLMTLILMRKDGAAKMRTESTSAPSRDLLQSSRRARAALRWLKRIVERKERLKAREIKKAETKKRQAERKAREKAERTAVEQWRANHV